MQNIWTGVKNLQKKKIQITLLKYVIPRFSYLEKKQAKNNDSFMLASKGCAKQTKKKGLHLRFLIE